MDVPSNVQGGFTRSVGGGKVFVQFRFKEKDINSLVADLNYATSPAVIQSAARVREYGESVLNYLKRRFPGKKTGTRESLNLKEGWRVRFYSGAARTGGTLAATASLWGFFIEHRRQRNERVNTILNSLEYGSRPYTIYPKDAQALKIPRTYPPGRSFAFAGKADIPSRSGRGFLRATEDYANRLTTTHGTYLEAELQRIIEKGARLRQTVASPTGSATLDAIEEVPQVISALAKQKNPLKAVARMKQRNKIRRLRAAR